MEVVNCQPLLDRLTLVLVKSGSISDLAKLKTQLDRIKFCLSVELLYRDVKINVRDEIRRMLSALYDQCVNHGKSEDEALKAKTLGSKAYMKKKDREALSYFTESVRCAPAESTVLPLAFANRSAVLYQLRKYKEALRDIGWAEENRYPEVLRHKLLVRRCRCHLMLEDVRGARQDLGASLAHLSSPSIPAEAKDKFEAEIADMKQKIESLSNNSSSNNNNNEKENASGCGNGSGGDGDGDGGGDGGRIMGSLQKPRLCEGENERVKYMTKAFEMRQDDRYGRHIAAVQEVSKGSEVFVEKPYAAILLPEHHTTHCHTCFTRLTHSNPFPCVGCRDAVFCGPECREVGRAWHQYECGILHILSSVGIAHLALRVMFVAGWKMHCDVRDEVLEGGCMTGVGRHGVYNGPLERDRYRAVYHLLPHLDNCLMEDNLQYCLAAILLSMAVCDKTHFIRDSINACGAKTELGEAQLAAAVTRHIAQLVSNAHAITQLTTSDCGGLTRVENIRQVRIASAIYPTASMMNHSCKPNIINSFYKDELVIRAIDDIKPGDHINNCYGPHYSRQPRSERQEALKQQYFFTCKCPPCTQPEYMQREAKWSGFYCESCGGVLSWMGDGDPGDNTSNDNRNNGGDGGGSDDSSSYGSGYGNGGGGSGVLVCLQCHKLQQPSTLLTDTCSRVNALYNTAEDALRQGTPSEAVSLLQEAVLLAAKVYLPENTFFVKVRDTLARVLGEVGDYEKCCVELGKCLRVMEQRYGSESIELAHEFIKYSEVLQLAAVTNPRFGEEANRVKQRRDDIFTLNYGPQWREYLGTAVD